MKVRTLKRRTTAAMFSTVVVRLRVPSDVAVQNFSTLIHALRKFAKGEPRV